MSPGGTFVTRFQPKAVHGLPPAGSVVGWIHLLLAVTPALNACREASSVSDTRQPPTAAAQGAPADALVAPSGEFMTARSPDRVTASDRPREYFPLTLPKQLAYDVAYKVTLLGAGKGQLLTWIEGRVLEGQEYVAHRNELSGTPLNATWERLYRNTDDGIMVRNNATGEDVLFLPHDLRVNREWLTELGDDRLHFQVLADEDVSWEGAAYPSCLVVQVRPQSGAYTERLWLAPGVGLVKIDRQQTHFSYVATLRSPDP
jgi:hypothetical protein